jgi:hypothetical protein
MFDRTALRRFLALAALLSGCVLLAVSADISYAGDTPPALRTIKPYAGTARVPRGVGGYSTTLSEVWGPPEMPPAPKDFGPHFDYPAEGMWNGVPTHSPYQD